MGVRDRLRHRLAGLSLRTRLVAAILALLTVVCLTVGGLSLLLLRGYLLDQRDEQVTAAAERASAAYSRQRGADYADHADHDVDDDPVPGFLNAPGQAAGTLSARIVAGRVRQAGVLDEEGASRVVGDDEEAALTDVPTDGDPHTRHVGRLGDYRLVAVPRTDDIVLVTGLPLRELDEIVHRLAVIVSAVALAGMVLAAAASAVLVRLNLRPLRRVAATAGRVSRQPLDRGEVSLAERVPAADTDVRTEVGQVGAALNRLIEHVAGALTARQASETQLRQFLADASHELRTPLAAIRGYAELAGRTPEPLPPDVAHALRRVSSQAERMTSLVEDMLLLARLDAGRPLASESVDLSQLVVDAVSDAHAAGPDHRWTLALPDEAVTVTGDGARLSQVLANLLANARVHTPPGTTVRAELVEQGREVVLAVLDDGPGIPRELLSRVFGRFARGDSSRSRAAGSTGLGLAIAQAVVVAHGGSITADSVPGCTVFTVRLPADRVPSSAPPTGPSPAAPWSAGGPAARSAAGPAARPSTRPLRGVS